MKPDFALVLSPDGIELLHRMQRGWTFLGRVDLEDPALRRKLAELRLTAVDLAPKGLAAKLILPESQVLFTTIPSPGPRESDRVAAVRATLDGMTPYGLDELAFDWEAEGDVLHVAVVARETLAEAEAFAVEHRFNPVSFVTRPKGGSFTGEPYFGETRLAVTLNGKAGRVKRDLAPTVVTLRAPRVQTSAAEMAPVAEPGPVADDGRDLRPAEDLAMAAATPLSEQPLHTADGEPVADEKVTDPQEADARLPDSAVLDAVAVRDARTEDMPPTPEGEMGVAGDEAAMPAHPRTIPGSAEESGDTVVKGTVAGEPASPSSEDAPGTGDETGASAASPTGMVIAPVLVETVVEFAETPQSSVPSFTTRRTVEPEVAATLSGDSSSDGFSSRLGSLIGGDAHSSRRDRTPTAAMRVSSTGLPASATPATRSGTDVRGAGLVPPGPHAPPRLGAASSSARRPIPPVSPSKIVGIRKAMAAQSARTGRNGKAVAAKGSDMPEARRLGADAPPRGKPRYVGLILTAGLLAVLGAVGIWSAVFGPEPDGPVTIAMPELAGPAELAAAARESMPEPGGVLATDPAPSRQVAPEAPADPALPSEMADLPSLAPVAPADMATLAPDSEAPAPSPGTLSLVEAPDVSIDVEGVATAALLPVETTSATTAGGPAPTELDAGEATSESELSAVEGTTADPQQATPEPPDSAVATAEPLAPAPLIVASPPDTPSTPEVDAIEGIYLASRDPSVPLAQGRGLAAGSVGADGGLPLLLPPPLPGIVYDLDELGLVRPTIEGAPTPTGTVVFLGRPPVVPPSRPDQTSPTDEQSPAEAATAPEAEEPAQGTASVPDAVAEDAPFALPGVPATRPRPRPSDLRGSLDSELVAPEADATNEVAVAALAGIRPRARPEALELPSDLQEETAGEVASATREVVDEIEAALQAVSTGAETPAADLAGEALALIDPAATPDTVPAPERAEGAQALDRPLALTPGPTDPRPRLRPQRLVETIAAQEAARVAQAAAAAAAIAAASDLAVAASPEPRPRPAGFGERAARIARANTVDADAVAVAAASAAAAVAAPQSVETGQTARAADPEAEADGEDDIELAAAPTASGNVQLPSRASVAAQATQENAIRLNELNLIGIFGAANDRRALVRLPTGRFVRVEVGARLDGGRVAAITDRELRYEKGGRTYTLRVAQRG